MPALKRLAPALIVLLAIAVGASTGKLFTDSDTGHYLTLAAGHPTTQPFAARQLAPLIVRALTHLGLGLHAGFWLLGILSIAFFVGSIAFFLKQANSPTWLTCSILGLYFYAMQFAGMVLPDLFYAALLSGFLLLLWQGRYGWASAMLLPLMVARESTLLVLLCWLFVGWRTLTLANRLGSVAAVASGAGIVHWLSTGSGTNREGLPPVLYMAGKMPWNFAKNFLGIEPWANLNPACGVPVWHHTLHLGPLHDIGFCHLEPAYPIRLVAYALATFGLLPLLLWHLRKTPRQGLLIRFSFLYGLTAFATAPLLGYSVQRLYGYGWSAFLIALPLMQANQECEGPPVRPLWPSSVTSVLSPLPLSLFAPLSLTASWLEWHLDKIPLLIAEIAIWAAGIWLLRKCYNQVTTK